MRKIHFCTHLNMFLEGGIIMLIDFKVEEDEYGYYVFAYRLVG